MCALSKFAQVPPTSTSNPILCRRYWISLQKEVKMLRREKEEKLLLALCNPSEVTLAKVSIDIEGTHKDFVKKSVTA